MSSLFLTNLTSPPLLFFFLGLIAVLVRSDLQIPSSIAKFLSIYLLMAIGFKGGVAIANSTLSGDVLVDLIAASAMAAIIPLIVYFFIKRIFSRADASAIAATYGSISAVTFVTAISYLDLNGVEWSGHLVAAMALMESPAIIIGLLLYKMHHSGDEMNWPDLFREALFNSSVLLIMGSLVIGWVSGDRGMDQMEFFISDLFVGVLCLFLLDMGIVAAQRLKDLQAANMPRSTSLLPAKMMLTAVGITLFNAIAAIGLALALNMPEGDAVLLVVLGASASYIAVPAAMRLALPEANPSIYLTMSLAITFPLNLLVGIPLYHQILRLFIG